MIAITLDTDWAPDYMIDAVADRLTAANAPATWFITHDSPAIRRLMDNRLFEIGIHPCLPPGSTQGETPEDVLAFCMALAPQARSMRTHRLAQSTPWLFQVVERTPVRIDASLYQHHVRDVRPFPFHTPAGTMLRIPHFWEDDFEMLAPQPQWTPDGLIEGDGVYVFDFHPVHVFLNGHDMTAYEGLKSRFGSIQRCDEPAARQAVSGEPGAATMLDALLARAAGRCVRLIDIAQRYAPPGVIPAAASR